MMGLEDPPLGVILAKFDVEYRKIYSVDLVTIENCTQKLSDSVWW